MSLTHLTPERLEELGQQYGLDGGGYNFTNMMHEPFASWHSFEWNDPDMSMITGETPKGGADILICRFHSSSSLPEVHEARKWPAHFDVSGGRYVKTCEGELYESEGECDCHGHPDEWQGIGSWEYTGNSADKPNPDCKKCDGSGFFTREALEYATYVCDLDAKLESGFWLVQHREETGPIGQDDYFGVVQVTARGHIFAHGVEDSMDLATLLEHDVVVRKIDIPELLALKITADLPKEQA